MKSANASVLGKVQLTSSFRRCATRTTAAHADRHTMRGFFGPKKPPRPKPKRYTSQPLLTFEVVSQQFKDVMHTYTNHHEIPCMFQMFQHAKPSRSWAMPPVRLSRNTRAFRNTPSVPCEVAKPMASRFNPARIPRPVLRGQESRSEP